MKLTLTQFLLCMRLTAACLILSAFLQVSARGYAQEKINIHAKDKSLDQILVQVRHQSGKSYWCDPALSRAYKHLTVDIKDATLEEALQQILTGTPLTYKFVDKYIVIEKKDDQHPSASENQFLPLMSIHGKILNEKGEPLAAATVVIKGTTVGTSTNDAGEFNLNNVASDGILMISHVGYEGTEVKLKGNPEIVVSLRLNITGMQEVSVSYNTGYQNIAAERAVGSFAKPDKDMMGARVAPDIISKLDGITSGLVLFNDAAGNRTITIRGLSTMFANQAPLIVIDGAEYDGDINNINPNDVKDITILKDAAAASIWGTRASNGVIVISTNRGEYNQPMHLDINSNVTVSQKPNLFYDRNYLGSNDFINVEQYLFNNGYYNSQFTSSREYPITPVVQLLQQVSNGQITQAAANAQIDPLRKIDVRNQLSKYFYQPLVMQQYYMNLSGGTSKTASSISAGYDNDRPITQGGTSHRITLTANNTYIPIKPLEFSLGVNYIEDQSKTDGALGETKMGGPNGYVLYPYAQLADGSGNPLPVVKDYNTSYVNQAISNGFLDWSFAPLLEKGLLTTTNKTSDIRVTPAIKVKILKGLQAQGYYQYEKSNLSLQSNADVKSYYARNLINEYSILNGNAVSGYAIPVGGILITNTTEQTSNTFRGQLDYTKDWGANNLTVLGGFEVKEFTDIGGANTLYGFDPNTDNYINVDPTTLFSLNPAGNSLIPYVTGISQTTNRVRSYFGNASYSFKQRYIFYASARSDQSNLFGATTNQRTVPLWSAGGKWKLGNEPFFKVKWLPQLDIRATYGFTGNIDNSLVALLTTQIQANDPITGQPYETISNAPNPDLKWERTAVVDLGVDFSLIHNILNGSLDGYSKKGMDLIGDNILAPSSGYIASSGRYQYRGNFGAMSGKGFDLTLNSINVRGKFTWTTSFMISHATDKVTDYNLTLPGAVYTGAWQGGASSTYPVKGRPVYSFFAYKWAGLDPTNGNPMGYDSKGNVSEDYATLTNPDSVSALQYVGPSRPTFFGGLRNTLSYKGFSLSFNISYKMGYYFRRSSLRYLNLFKTGQGNAEFANRWQNPGDEKHTNVPSMTFPANSARDNFYQNSVVTIDKGDAIRFQDCSLSYQFNTNSWRKIPLRSLQIYAYANNLGILYRANKDHLDPEYPTGIPPSKTIAFGIKTSLY